MTSISLKIEAFFKNQNYGAGVKELYFGLICVSPPPPGHPDFHKVRPPRLQKISRVRNAHGKLIISENILSMDIKLDFEQIKAANSRQVFNAVKKSVLGNLYKLEKYNGRFDYYRFKKDMESVLDDFEYEEAKEMIEAGF